MPVRAQIQTVYHELIDEVPQITNGFIELPRRPGLGVSLNPDFFQAGREGYRISKA